MKTLNCLLDIQYIRHEPNKHNIHVVSHSSSLTLQNYHLTLHPSILLIMKANSCKYYKSRDLITKPRPLKLNIPYYCSTRTRMKQKQCLRRYRQQQNTR